MMAVSALELMPQNDMEGERDEDARHSWGHNDIVSTGAVDAY